MEKEKTLMKKIYQHKFIYLWLTPFILFFVVFRAYPLFHSVYLSFFKYSGFGEPVYVGLKNYIGMFKFDQRFVMSMVNTFWYWVMLVPVKVIICITLAYIINFKWLKFKSIFRVTYLLPYVTAGVVFAMIFRVLLDADGIINYILQLFFNIEPIAWLKSTTWSKPAVALLSHWRTTGYTLLIMLAGMQRIPTTVYEAAEIDGAGPFRKFFNITVPLMKPIILYVIIMSSIWTFQLFAEPMILTKGGPRYSSSTMALRMYQAGFETFQFGYASAIALVIFGFILLINMVEFKVFDRE